MMLCVKNGVRDSCFFKNERQLLGFLDRNGTNKHGLTFFTAFSDLIDNCSDLALIGGIYRVLTVDSDHWLVCRNLNNVKSIDGLELVLLGKRRTGHTRQLSVHTEIILEGNGSNSTALALNVNAFLGLNSLVQTVVVSSAGHKSACKCINNKNVSVFYYIVHLVFHNAVCLDGNVNVVVNACVFGV